RQPARAGSERRRRRSGRADGAPEPTNRKGGTARPRRGPPFVYRLMMWWQVTGAADWQRAGIELLGAGDRGETAEPSLPIAEVTHGLCQVIFAEIGPVQRRRPVFGVGRLPDQEVAQAHLPGRPDHQVWIAHAAGVEI